MGHEFAMPRIFLPATLTSTAARYKWPRTTIMVENMSTATIIPSWVVHVLRWATSLEHEDPIVVGKRLRKLADAADKRTGVKPGSFEGLCV